MNDQLKTALHFAGQANDIAGLKSLARQESNRADQMERLLAAVLAVAGPVRIHGDLLRLEYSRFTMTKDGDDWIVRYEPPPNRAL